MGCYTTERCTESWIVNDEILLQAVWKGASQRVAKFDWEADVFYEDTALSADAGPNIFKDPSVWFVQSQSIGHELVEHVEILSHQFNLNRFLNPSNGRSETAR
jgi:hypothetical protein